MILRVAVERGRKDHDSLCFVFSEEHFPWSVPSGLGSELWQVPIHTSANQWGVGRIIKMVWINQELSSEWSAVQIISIHDDAAGEANLSWDVGWGKPLQIPTTTTTGGQLLLTKPWRFSVAKARCLRASITLNVLFWLAEIDNEMAFSLFLCSVRFCHHSLRSTSEIPRNNSLISGFLKIQIP